MCALREMQFCNTNVLLITLCLSSIFLREPRGGKIFQGLDFPRVLLTIDQKLRDIKYFFCKTLGVISIKESIINDQDTQILYAVGFKLQLTLPDCSIRSLLCKNESGLFYIRTLLSNLSCVVSSFVLVPSSAVCYSIPKEREQI